jgi:hypothetical protein
MSRVIALFLVLCVALTSQAFALARGHSAATTQMVICTGSGFISVTFDAQGNPTGPAHLCPDAITALGAATVAATLPVRAETPARPALIAPTALLHTAHTPGLAQARAPPVPA